MTTIEGSYSTDLQLWINFGAERMEDVIRSVPAVSGLKLAGRLSKADCQCIYSKRDSLVVLSLQAATLPADVNPSSFLVGAPRLRRFTRPAMCHT